MLAMKHVDPFPGGKQRLYFTVCYEEAQDH